MHDLLLELLRTVGRLLAMQEQLNSEDEAELEACNAALEFIIAEHT